MPAFSAFCVAAPRSGEGKTTAAMALCRALRERGLAVQAFNLRLRATTTEEISKRQARAIYIDRKSVVCQIGRAHV